MSAGESINAFLIQKYFSQGRIKNYGFQTHILAEACFTWQYEKAREETQFLKWSKRDEKQLH